MSRRAALLAVLALAACTKGTSSPSLRLRQPTGVAVFRGYTDRHPGVVYPYVAVANSGSDELVLVDPVTDEAVASTVAIRPLSIPIPDPRPMQVVSAQLGDDDVATTPPTSKPDLLVALSTASRTLQLVRTWQTGSSPDPEVDDAKAVDLGQTVQALIAVPAVDGGGNVVAGQAWVIAALQPVTGQGTDLAVVTYRRPAPTDTDYDTNQPGAIVPASLKVSVVQHLEFEVRSLGADPTDPRFLYAASADPIPDAAGVFGVAELGLTGGPGAFVVRGLDAGAATTLVAGFTPAERNVDATGTYDQIVALPADSTETLVGCSATSPRAQWPSAEQVDYCPQLGFPHPPDGTIDQVAAVRRVYAVLDAAHCGPSQPIACGVVVLDPVSDPSPVFGHLLKNPFAGHPEVNAGIGRSHDDAAEPYLPPISIPATAQALVPMLPPSNPPSSDRSYQKAPFIVVAPSYRARLSTGVLAIPAGNGKIYLLDLARWELLSDPYALQATTSTALGISTYAVGVTSLPQIGFYLYSSSADAYVLRSDVVSAKTALVRDPNHGVGGTQAERSVFVNAFTLGYTPDEYWAITYQGFLPGLDIARPAEVENGPAAGQLRVALQARTTTNGLTQVFRVYDPTYGVRLGDIVQMWTTSDKTGTVCPATDQSTDTNPIYPFEGKVASIDPPDAAHPGGSLVLEQPDPWVRVNGALTKEDTDAQSYWNGTAGKGNCRAALGTGVNALAVRVRARGWDPNEPDPANHHEFVVSGASLGYVGRAVENSAADVDVKNGTPRPYTLRTQDPSTLPCPLIPWPADPASVACDAACRQTCEDLVVARKARRIWNVSVRCPVGDITCNDSYPMFDVRQRDSSANALAALDPSIVLQPTGPVMTFWLGVDYTGKVNPDRSTKLLSRDTVIHFGTRSGFGPSSRYGSAYSGGTGIQPSGGAVFDRSADPSWDRASEGVRLYVPYLGGTLIDGSPSHSNSFTAQLR